MTSRERILLGLAVVGFLVPNTMVAVFLIDHGPELGGYFEHWFESLPAAPLVAALAGDVPPEVRRHADAAAVSARAVVVLQAKSLPRPIST